MPGLVAAMEAVATSPVHVVVVGPSVDDPETAAALSTLRGAYVPNRVILFVADLSSSGDLPSGAPGTRIASLAPYVADMSMVDGRPTVYVCRNFACQLPTTDIDAAMGLMTAGLADPDEPHT